MIACDCEVCTSSNNKDKRLRSSILVQSARTTLVVDTTPDFRYQMLRAGVKKMDGILYTHPHKDHIAGLDDVRAFNFFNEVAVNIYANALTQQALKNEFHYVFAEHRYPGIPDVVLNDIDTDLFMVGDIPVQPIKVRHLHMPVLGFRFGSFTYITDANHIDDQEKAKIVGSEIIVLNALRIQKHISHFNLQEAIDMADELKIPGAYFTHISHQLGLHETVNAQLPSNRRLAFDMKQFQLD